MFPKTIPALVVATAVAVHMAPAAQAAAKPSAPYAGQTSWSKVAPTGLEGPQSWTNLNSQQKNYARIVVQEAHKDHVSPYGAVIAVATALQESKFVNYTDAVDHDSLGIFQQRPSMGWGSATQIENPAHATDSFLDRLKHSDYQDMNLTDAAQNVQRSADPYAYAKWQLEATEIVSEISNGKF
jgi:hypothetical protein